MRMLQTDYESRDRRLYLVGIPVAESWGENEVENTIIGSYLRATSTPVRC